MFRLKAARLISFEDELNLKNRRNLVSTGILLLTISFAIIHRLIRKQGLAQRYTYCRVSDAVKRPLVCICGVPECGKTLPSFVFKIIHFL